MIVRIVVLLRLRVRPETADSVEKLVVEAAAVVAILSMRAS